MGNFLRNFLDNRCLVREYFYNCFNNLLDVERLRRMDRSKIISDSYNVRKLRLLIINKREFFIEVG